MCEQPFGLGVCRDTKYCLFLSTVNIGGNKYTYAYNPKILCGFHLVLWQQFMEMLWEFPQKKTFFTTQKRSPFPLVSMVDAEGNTQRMDC